jgi:heme exporter protein C
MSLRVANGFGLLGLVLLLVGSYFGLVIAPPDRFMGDVMRILYIHVPVAWNALLCLTYAFVFAICSLSSGKQRWDWLMEAAIEVGLVLGVLLTMQGSIWARPTWGVWWDWDPRLTSVAVMNVTFLGIVALRGFVDDAEQRRRWSAVATILAYANVPIVYMSVKWWRTLHQMQSTPQTVDAMMVIPLRINAFAVLFLSIWFIRWRYELARRTRSHELAPPPLGAEAT